VKLDGSGQLSDDTSSGRRTQRHAPDWRPTS